MSKRLKIQFSGIVQGVGFRPFIYKYAKELNLTGFVRNNTAGVDLELEGPRIDEFMGIALNNLPPLAKIDDYSVNEIEIKNSIEFKIIKSNSSNSVSMIMSPDIAICSNCRDEYYSLKDRRSFYPFINCTDCGPRFSIIKDLPYDRPKTTMKKFEMCDNCRFEYENPLDRRYHAQPVSCYDCGPEMNFDKMSISSKQAVELAIDKLKKKKVVAIKGIGGYHLACLASSDIAVKRLREKKKRQKKPFALMANLKMIRELVFVSKEEKKILTGITAPVLLLKTKMNKSKYVLSEYIAPGQNTLGFMIPYTPLHLEIIDKIGEPLIMTSANYSDEPIIYKDNNKYLIELSDHILSHNRDINIFTDDSVMEVFDDKPYMIRRSRGYAPAPLVLPLNSKKRILSIGAMFKTTFTMIKDNKAFMSQYIGNTDSPYTLEAEENVIRHFEKLFQFTPEIIVMDKHPDFPNRAIHDNYKGIETIEIQHHKAHIGALLAEKRELDGVIGLSMDGTGYGDDGKIWGGEIFIGDYKNLKRFGHLKYINLPGGEKAINEPWRFTLSMLYANYKNSDIVNKYAEKFGNKGLFLLESMRKMDDRILTSSCGRVFDGIATLLGLGDINYYDGYLPVLLQNNALNSNRKDEIYNYSIDTENDMKVLDLLPMLDDIINDNSSIQNRAYRFHNTLSKSFEDICILAREKHSINKVGLTGGVFQNTLLLKLTKDRLQKAGFEVLIHSEFAPNDSSISLGQGFLGIGSS